VIKGVGNFTGNDGFYEKFLLFPQATCWISLLPNANVRPHNEQNTSSNPLAIGCKTATG